MKRLFMVLMLVCFLTACSSPVIDVEIAEQEKVTESVVVMESVETTATAEIEPTATIESTIKPTQTPLIAETSEPTEKPIVKPTNKPAPAATEKPTAKPTKQPAPEVTAEPMPITTEKPTPVATPKPTAEPTSKPTQAPSYTVISNSSFRNRALSGINEARDEEGVAHAKLDGSLNSKAEAHAIAMAKSNSCYHSSLGYTESVSSGADIGGWAEGYGAACHASQLATEAAIIRIGVGSAKSADGTVYTCIIGAR